MVAGVIDLPGVVPADPKDDKIVAAAFECAAEYVVSEDRHLLDLGIFGGIRIVNRDTLLAELDRRDATHLSP
jgi:predicted nucleic acid-binding protein